MHHPQMFQVFLRMKTNLSWQIYENPFIGVSAPSVGTVKQSCHVWNGLAICIVRSCPTYPNKFIEVAPTIFCNIASKHNLQDQWMCSIPDIFIEMQLAHTIHNAMILIGNL